MIEFIDTRGNFHISAMKNTASTPIFSPYKFLTRVNHWLLFWSLVSLIYTQVELQIIPSYSKNLRCLEIKYDALAITNHIKYPLWLPLLIWASFSNSVYPNLQLWKSFHALITSSCSFGEEVVIAGRLNEKLTCRSVCLPTESWTSSFANQQTSHTYYRHWFIKANHRGKNSWECQIVSRFMALIKLVFLCMCICMTAASQANGWLLVTKSKIADININCMYLGLSQLIVQVLISLTNKLEFELSVSVMAWE